MRLLPLRPVELRERLGLSVDVEGVPLRSSLEHLLRLAVQRWRLAERREVMRFVHRQLEACDCDGPEARERLQEAERRLLLLSDLEEVSVSGTRHLAATEARWVRLTRDVAVLSGTLPQLPEGLRPSRLPGEDPSGPSRRFALTAPEVEGALRRAGVREVSLSEWLGTPEPECLVRALGRPSDPERGVEQHWEARRHQLEHEGSPVHDASAFRILSGSPGGYFGQAGGPEPTGRWSGAEVDGLWCGQRRGFGSEHWHPVLVSIEDGTPRQAIALSGWDELNWLVLARGQALGAPEVVRWTPERMSLTFPPPAQLERLLELLGERTGAWQWQVPEGAERTWEWGRWGLTLTPSE